MYRPTAYSAAKAATTARIGHKTVAKAPPSTPSPAVSPPKPAVSPATIPPALPIAAIILPSPVSTGARKPNAPITTLITPPINKSVAITVLMGPGRFVNHFTTADTTSATSFTTGIKA